MAFVHTPSDPTDLDGLRRFLRAQDTESQLLPLEMLRIEISHDAHLKLGQAVAEALAHAGTAKAATVVLLTDTSAIMRGDQRLSTLVQSQLNGYPLKTVVLDGGHKTLHADEATLDAAESAVMPQAAKYIL